MGGGGGGVQAIEAVGRFARARAEDLGIGGDAGAPLDGNEVWPPSSRLSREDFLPKQQKEFSSSKCKDSPPLVGFGTVRRTAKLEV